MFLIGRPKKELCTLNHGRGVNSFDTAMIALSMFRYDAALISLISSLEAFLSSEENNDSIVDERSFWPKVTDFNKTHESELIYNFKKYSEHNEEPKKLLREAYKLRNRILHSGHSSRHNNVASKYILKSLIPMLQSVYEILFKSNLIDHLDKQIEEHFSTIQYFSKNYKFNEDEWMVGLLPLTWAAQNYISPNFAPRYLWDKERYEIDDGDLIIKALSNVKTNLDELGVYCPICKNHSVALEYGLQNNGKKPHEIVINEAFCVKCQLDLGSGSAQKALSSALFDQHITENEPRLIKEFGLS
jgi:hypothetical protein